MNIDEAMKAVESVDKRITSIVQKTSGDKYSKVVDAAIEMCLSGKKPERALADALEQFKLV
jgi:hypothetical protein